MRRILLLVVASGFAVGAWGVASADPTIPAHRFSTHDGLPSNQITALAQTNNGLLWIGTTRGLVVYDGHEFRPIPMPDSVRKKSVLALEPMPDGSVWAGVGHDAVKAMPHGVVQIHLLDSHHVAEILRRDGRVRVVTHRAVWTLGKRLAPARTSFRYETLSDVTLVRGADFGPEGRLWILNTRRGPGRVRSDGTVVFPDLGALPGGSVAVGDRKFSDLCAAVEGEMLVTRETRLFRFDPGAGTFALAATDLTNMSEIHRKGGTAYLTGGPVVRRYNTGARRMEEPLRLDGSDQVSPTSAALHGREGGLWVGAEEGLLHARAPGARHIETIDGTELRYGMGFRRHEGAVWANTWGDGLFRLWTGRQRVVPGGHAQWVLPRSHDAFLHALAGPGRQWYRWGPVGGWKRVGLADEAVRGYVDSSGIGYFWHNDGLYRHVPAGDTTEATRLRAWPVGESQHHLMGPAPNGDIILFDEGEVLRLRRPDGAVTDTIASVPEHASSGGRRLTIDPKGHIWCPFSSLLRIDLQDGTTRALLEGADVENVQMAGDSLAMAKTNAGLYLLDIHTGAVRRHLTREDGLLSNDVNGSLLTSDSLFVGHQTGYTSLPTESLFAPPPSPRSVLTGLEVNLDDRSLAAGSLRAADERTIGFSYTGASLRYPDRVHYEVRLTSQKRLAPQDTAWSSTDRRFARYTNLAPGTYRFEVRARLEGRPPGPVASYAFTIPPYFYETWWFRLLVGLGLVGLGVGAYRWRTRRLQRRREELERLVNDRTEQLAEEKRKTEAQAERLAELDEAKNRFFAHISHEFRTPLSLILSPLRDALQRATGGSVSLGKRELRRMTSNAERLRRLIDQLLELATLEAGQMELERRPADLARLTERVVTSFESKAEQKGLNLQTEVPDEGLDAGVDPQKVETIISNLVGNAVKFTPDGGTVTVRLRETDASEKPQGERSQGGRPWGERPRSLDEQQMDGVAQIEVSDTGPGIASEAQSQIFDRFRQAGGSETRKREGTGLGLALTSELVELHEGSIELESTPGEGATFTVWLPLMPMTDSTPEGTRGGDGAVRDNAEASIADHGGTRAGRDGSSNPGDGTPDLDEEADPEAPKAGSATQAESNTVLVVEDNDEMRAYLREILSERWAVQVAENGEEAWDLIQAEAPDLVLSDVMMPETGGAELCERIKSAEAHRVTPVLLLTAKAGEEATVEGLESGADDFVTKPFGPEELRGRIENHLAAREHARACYRNEVSLSNLGEPVEEKYVPFLETVTEATEAHLSDPDFTTDQLAEEVALSRRQLTRRLKKAIGKTPAEFVRDCRIERAKTLLEEESRTVAEVAYAVGFRSPSHFSQAFQEEAGPSPSAYRDA